MCLWTEFSSSSVSVQWAPCGLSEHVRVQTVSVVAAATATALQHLQATGSIPHSRCQTASCFLNLYPEQSIYTYWAGCRVHVGSDYLYPRWMIIHTPKYLITRSGGAKKYTARALLCHNNRRKRRSCLPAFLFCSEDILRNCTWMIRRRAERTTEEGINVSVRIHLTK